MTETLVRSTRRVPVGVLAAPADPVDLRIVDGTVTEVAPRLRAGRADRILDAAGRWAIPGLWDAHVHLSQWAQASGRLDLTGTRTLDDALDRVRAHVAELGPDPTAVIGTGHRSAAWSAEPTVAALDAVSYDHPVVLISGDSHHGWLNSAALRFFGLRARVGTVTENEWFALYLRLGELPAAELDLTEAVRRSVADAARLGIVGVVDLELTTGPLEWAERYAVGIDQLRVRASVYPDGLAGAIAARRKTGDRLPGGAGLLTMGPLKIISDGSLNTRTALCCEPYVDAAGMDSPYGRANVEPQELDNLLRQAHQAGLEVALHAIGDAACRTALDTFAATGAAGSLEHAQLMRFDDIDRMAALGIRASVQPAHLLDDRDVVERYWPDRAERCFALQTMIRSGVEVVLGSDAPVSPLDPWLAMAAAVHRSADERAPWHAAEALTAAQALAASTDGQPTLAVGSRGDLVLVDADPLADVGDSAAVAEHLRAMPVAATLVAGRPTYSGL